MQDGSFRGLTDRGKKGSQLKIRYTYLAMRKQLYPMYRRSKHYINHMKDTLKISKDTEN